jgi:hypothetical protein
MDNGGFSVESIRDLFNNEIEMILVRIMFFLIFFFILKQINHYFSVRDPK